MKSEVTWKLSTIFAIRNRLNNLLYVTKHVNSSSKSIKATLFAQISHFRRICPIVASLPPGILPHPATGIFIETTGSNLNHSSSLVSKKKHHSSRMFPFSSYLLPPKDFHALTRRFWTVNILLSSSYTPLFPTFSNVAQAFDVFATAVRFGTQSRQSSSKYIFR